MIYVVQLAGWVLFVYLFGPKKPQLEFDRRSGGVRGLRILYRLLGDVLVYRGPVASPAAFPVISAFIIAVSFTRAPRFGGFFSIANSARVCAAGSIKASDCAAKVLKPRRMSVTSAASYTRALFVTGITPLGLDQTGQLAPLEAALNLDPDTIRQDDLHP